MQQRVALPALISDPMCFARRAVRRADELTRGFSTRNCSDLADENAVAHDHDGDAFDSKR
jgi:hypothetical protein